MPINVLAETRKNDPKDIEAVCTQRANSVYNCIFNDAVEFAVGDLTHKTCYTSDIYTDFKAAYDGALKEFRKLGITNLRDFFDAKNKKQRFPHPS